MKHLIKPHGGKLINLITNAERATLIKKESRDWPSLNLTPRQICDLELLLSGGFSPLTGFMTREDYESVCSSLALANGMVWPIPITLDVPEEIKKLIEPGVRSGNAAGTPLALRDPEGVMLAVLHVEDLWQPDLEDEALKVFGTKNPEHPTVRYLLEQTNPWYVGGRIEGIQLPDHYDYRNLRRTPYDLRKEFARLGWRRVIAFQTRNPMHRAHYELTLKAVRDSEANLLIHPVVGMTKPGDIDYYTRVRCYLAVQRHYPRHTVKLSLLPLAMRMAGPREALLHAVIRKNYGCTHLIVGRDHAGVGADSTGKPFYGPYDAQDLLREYESRIGVKMIPFQMMVYVKERDTYEPADSLPENTHSMSLSGTELRERLAEGRDIPAWFTFPEVAHELRRTYPPRYRQGFTVFFTGLSGAGKSTVAKALMAMLLENGDRPVTLLDGDIVRKNLSSELGFSKEHRDINILRIGYVASEITKNGGIAICAPIAPYDRVRKEVRSMISPLGGFILVHIATPLEVCERRDRKGLYAKARAGIIKEFTGISDPYEEPDDAEVVIDTTDLTPGEETQVILLHLEQEGYIGGNQAETIL